MSNHFDEFLCDRNDDINTEAQALLRLLAGFPEDYSEDDLPWDIHPIAELVDAAKDILGEIGISICHPFYSGAERTPCYLTDECQCERCLMKTAEKKEDM